MGAPAHVATLLVGLTWRATGLNALGRRLVARVGSTDDDVRQLALMALAGAGDRGVAQVLDAYERGSTSTNLPQVLVSVGTPGARAALIDLTSNGAEQVRLAAERALTDLKGIDNDRNDGSS